MALKSVVEIDIDDSDFKRFAAEFSKYSTTLQTQPGAWKEVSEAATAASAAASSAAAATAEMGVTVGASLRVLAEMADQSKQTSGFWSSIAQSAGKFTSRVVEATRSLLRWGELTGLISGIIGGGGLYGIDRLAINAGEQRRKSLGLGVTPGEANAFQVDYGRLVDPQQFLSGVNEALHDVTKRVGLYGANITEDEMKGKDTAEVGSDLLTHLKKIADQTPDAMMGNVMTARHLDQFISLQDFQRLKNTPAGELDEYKQNFQRDTHELELTRQTTKAWQDLQVQFHRGAEVLENTLIKGLIDLTGPLGNLSAAFTKLVGDLLESKVIRGWIDDLATHIQRFDDYIGKPEFRDHVISFMEGVDHLAAKVVEFVENVAAIVETLGSAVTSIKTWFGGLDPKHPLGDAKGGVNGPLEDDNPNAPGSPEFNKRRHPADYNPDGTRKDATPTPWDRMAPEREKNQTWLKGVWDRLWGGAAQAAELPRGIRNNNPLNLTYAGQEGALGSDDRFGVYETPEAGIAASERQLTTYQDKYGLDSIAEILSKWAPPSENDTAGYIEQVSKETGLKPNQHLDLHDRDTMQKLVSAMIARETGRHMDSDVVQRGVNQGMGGPTQAAGPKFVPPAAIRAPVVVKLYPEPGANPYISTSQLAY